MLYYDLLTDPLLVHDRPIRSYNDTKIRLRIKKGFCLQKNILTLFWRSAIKYRFWTAILLINPALTVVVGAFLGPFIIAQLLDQLQTGGLTLAASWPLIGYYALTQIYGEIIGWRLTLYCSWKMQTAAQRDLYGRVFQQLTGQSLSFHSDRFTGSLVSQTTKLTGSFERFWDTLVFQLLPVVASILTAVIILSFYFWQYALFVAVISTIFAIFVFYTSRFMAELNTKEAQANTAMNGRLADVISNVMAVKAHGNEDVEAASAHKLSKAWRKRSLMTMSGFLKVSTGYSGMIAIINMVALISAIWASEHNLISIAVVYLAITYSFTVARQLWEMNSIMRNYNRIMGDAHDMAEILSLEPVVKDKGGDELRITKGAVAFEGVSFTHDSAANASLFEDFSLNIEPGQKVGLVGHSGSGKTTFTRLLLRFSDVDEGVVSIDGQNVANVTQASLRRAIAYVPQEPLLFHRSLHENIAYGRPDATNKQVHEAARKAHALEFIEKLPNGFETMVGERGVKLSGGQRQRIVIARAILKNAPILVLDEATSALDSESEKLIQASLTELMKDRTTVVIAHRLSTIQKMDRIIVLEDGKIIEDGSHTKLLAQKGTYASLWSHQSGGFIEE